MQTTSTVTDLAATLARAAVVKQGLSMLVRGVGERVSDTEIEAAGRDFFQKKPFAAASECEDLFAYVRIDPRRYGYTGSKLREADYRAFAEAFQDELGVTFEIDE
jgi:hypothetical protein